MKKDTNAIVLTVVAGAFIGMVFGCLVTWYPIRLSFCAYYNAPDCEEIVLMAFPLYCFIGPLIGGTIAYLIYRRRREAVVDDSILQDEIAGADEEGEDLKSMP